MKIKVDGRHGSGVHIGGGAIITAAHVVGDAIRGVTIHTDDGAQQVTEVLWANASYDVALIRVLRIDRIEQSALECIEPALGQVLIGKGNPLTYEFLSMTGKVAGPAQRLPTFISAIPIDMSVAGGMSGGPLFDLEGSVVGIINAMAIQSMGFTGAPVGITIGVPGKGICVLLGRVS